MGRISKHLLIHRFEVTDVLEPAKNLMDKAKEDLKDEDKIGNFYQIGMQDLKFDHKYDCIWIQWVIGHLIDNDLIEYLQKCKKYLTPRVYLIKKGMYRH